MLNSIDKAISKAEAFFRLCADVPQCTGTNLLGVDTMQSVFYRRRKLRYVSLIFFTAVFLSVDFRSQNEHFSEWPKKIKSIRSEIWTQWMVLRQILIPLRCKKAKCLSDQNVSKKWPKCLSKQNRFAVLNDRVNSLAFEVHCHLVLMHDVICL